MVSVAFYSSDLNSDLLYNCIHSLLFSSSSLESSTLCETAKCSPETCFSLLFLLPGCLLFVDEMNCDQQELLFIESFSTDCQRRRRARRRPTDRRKYATRGRMLFVSKRILTWNYTWTSSPIFFLFSSISSSFRPFKEPILYLLFISLSRLKRFLLRRLCSVTRWQSTCFHLPITGKHFHLPGQKRIAEQDAAQQSGNNQSEKRQKEEYHFAHLNPQLVLLITLINKTNVI